MSINHSNICLNFSTTGADSVQCSSCHCLQRQAPMCNYCSGGPAGLTCHTGTFQDVLWFHFYHSMQDGVVPLTVMCDKFTQNSEFTLDYLEHSCPASQKKHCIFNPYLTTMLCSKSKKLGIKGNKLHGLFSPLVQLHGCLLE